jgi:mono/diheme cytochrome c family protein
MSCRGLVLSLAVSVPGCVLLGCGKSTQHPPGSPQALFDEHCARCHAQAGQPGGPPGVGSSKGPNLSKITTRPGRDAEYIAKFIRDPKSVNPDARLMPAFQGEISEEDIRKLAEYVAAQK